MTAATHFVAPFAAGLKPCTTPAVFEPPSLIVRTFRSAVGTSVQRPSADGGASRRDRNDVTSICRGLTFRRGARARVKARSA